VKLSVLILAAPFLFYLVPFLTGYAWNNIGPLTPDYPGMAGSLDRRPAVTTAVEHYGTGVVAVPFRARLRAYLRDGDLPLWNPYSGLGQPFAAQGEGSPYFPLAVVRALLPGSWANAVTFLSIAVSAGALFGFLRLLGLAPATAAFGGAAWAISGAFTLNLARDNYVDQFAMIPPLFLAAAWAIASRRALAYVAFAAVVCLHAVAGLLQIGVNTLLLLAGFLVFFSCLRAKSLPDRLTTIIAAFLFLGLGTALAAPYVLPIVEGVRATFNKNAPNLAFLAMPTANMVAFFFPLVFGQIFQTWIAGQFPNVAEWNNLYAHGSTGLLLLTVLALAGLSRARVVQQMDQRLAYLFFLGGLIFFQTRYLSLLPGSLVSYLPILSQQSPKHTNGPAVFCLVMTACFGVEWLRSIEWRRAVVLLTLTLAALLGTLGWLAWRLGGLAVVDTRLAAIHLGITATIVLGLVLAFSLAHRAPTNQQAALIATAAVVGESSVYLLLGNDDIGILALRLGIGVLIGLAGILAARATAEPESKALDSKTPGSLVPGSRRALVPAAVAGLLALGAYAWVIVWPTAGLPRRVDVDAPPRYMAWLHEAAGQEYRAFGIYPDYSSVGEIQDVEVVGPLATNEWVAFVDLVSSPAVAKFHRIGSTFSLVNKIEPTIWYDLTTDYPRARPLFDWAGVRYIVLDKAAFNGRWRSDHQALLDPAAGLRVAYEDEVVTILESPTAQTKAFFTTQVREGGASTTLASLQAAPHLIDGPVTVEGDLGDAAHGAGVGSGQAVGQGASFPVSLAEYRPNGLRATFEAPGPGLFVVKDSYFPGWQATLNGEPAQVLQVDGLVRGVSVPSAGRYELTMAYRPASFVNGVLLAAATLALLLTVAVWRLMLQRR
jgi:hypothetical protein